MQPFRNSEGLNLLTGAPNVRSLRLWLNQANEPRAVGKRPMLSGNGFDDSSINKEERCRAGETSKDLGHRRIQPADSEAKTVIHTFDNVIPTKREIEIDAVRFNDVGTSCHSEIYALQGGGRLVLISGNNSAPGNNGLKLEDFKVANLLSATIRRGSQTSDGGPPYMVLSEDDPHLPTSIDWLWSEQRQLSFLPISKVCCGQEHICCVTDMATGARLYAWGSNEFGQCGQGDTRHNKLLSKPVLVHAITSPVSELGCGAHYTCCTAWMATGESLFSFGGGAPSGRFSSLFKAHIMGDGSVPHANIGASQAPQVLVDFQPGPNGASPGHRPFRFWTKTLSSFIADADHEWQKTESLTSAGTRLSASRDGGESFENIVELENARSRLRRMRASLKEDIERGASSFSGNIFDDPAPFEVEKALSNLAYELEANQLHKELLESDSAFEKDVAQLNQQRDVLLGSKAVYESIRTVWEGAPLSSRRLECDSEVLYALLEDCRRSELAYLAREQGLNRKQQQNITDAHKIGVQTLLDASDAILHRIQEGLLAFTCPENLKPLFAGLTSLHAKKSERNALIRRSLRSIAINLGTAARDQRRRLSDGMSTQTSNI
jgi:hypothetical protein